MSPQNRHAISRFALKTTFLLVFALAHWQSGYASTLGILFAIASMIDVLMALVRKAPIRFGMLTYWDEAAAFMLMSGLATATAQL